MRKVALAGAVFLALSHTATEARQCYRRVVEPPLFTNIAEQVMVTPAHDVNQYVPAVTRLVAETVVVRPAETVTRVIPPQFGYQEETVEVSPAHREWRTRDEGGEIIGCWVNVPPRLARLARRVLIAPGARSGGDDPAGDHDAAPRRDRRAGACRRPRRARALCHARAAGSGLARRRAVAADRRLRAVSFMSSRDAGGS